MRVHISPQVRSLVSGSPCWVGGMIGMGGRVADHEHLLQAWERDDGGLDAHYRVRADRCRLVFDALEGEVPGGVENLAVFGDLATLQAAEHAREPTTDADGVGDVAEG